MWLNIAPYTGSLSAMTPSISKITASKRRCVTLLAFAECGGEDDLADRAPVCQQHHQAVDADAESARRRHSVLQGVYVVLVDALGLVVAGLAQARLFEEA